MTMKTLCLTVNAEELQAVIQTLDKAADGNYLGVESRRALHDFALSLRNAPETKKPECVQINLTDARICHRAVGYYLDTLADFDKRREVLTAGMHLHEAIVKAMNL